MSRLFVPQIMEALKQLRPAERQELLYAMATDKVLSEDIEDLADLLRTRSERSQPWEVFRKRLRLRRQDGWSYSERQGRQRRVSKKL